MLLRTSVQCNYPRGCYDPESDNDSDLIQDKNPVPVPASIPTTLTLPAHGPPSDSATLYRFSLGNLHHCLLDKTIYQKNPIHWKVHLPTLPLCLRDHNAQEKLQVISVSVYFDIYVLCIFSIHRHAHYLLLYDD